MGMLYIYIWICNRNHEFERCLDGHQLPEYYIDEPYKTIYVFIHN